ncbi:MAG: AAA family ATPase [Alphaproteobacteria bacterium]|nr:AAA family ATPase [Alphaproteobacteria bacterium]
MLTPRENLHLFGHLEAREHFLNAVHSQRFSHGWILSGPFGVGKATFAYHMARYILSNREDRNTTFTQDDPLCCRIRAQSHGDLWTVGGGEGGEIGIEPIRQLTSFLSQTTFEGGWRVVIIDGVEKLNRNAANALLKSLEEPPAKTVFFLVTASISALFPTIRSRCQILPLLPLEEEHVKSVLQSQKFDVPSFFHIAQGSPGRLIRLMEGKGEKIFHDLTKILEGAPATTFIQTHGGDEASFDIIEDLLRNHLHAHLVEKAEGRPSFFEPLSLEEALELHNKVTHLFDQCRRAQLDKKVTLNCILANLKIA